MARYVGALDQGTTSTRFIIFDHGGIIAVDQKEHRQIYPNLAGWNMTPWRSGQTPRQLSKEHSQRAISPRQTSRHRRDQSARNCRSLGKSYWQTSLQCHCLARYTHGRHLQRTGQGRRSGLFAWENRPSACHLFLRPQDQVDS